MTNRNITELYAFGFIDRIVIAPLGYSDLNLTNHLDVGSGSVTFNKKVWLGTHYGLTPVNTFSITKFPNGGGVSWAEYRKFSEAVVDAVMALSEKVEISPTNSFAPQAYAHIEEWAGVLLELTTAELTEEQKALKDAIVNEVELNFVRFPFTDRRALVSDTAAKGLKTLTHLLGIECPSIYTDALTRNNGGEAVFDPQAFFTEFCKYLGGISWESYLRKYTPEEECVLVEWHHAEIRIYFNTGQDTVLILDKERECFVQAEADNLAFDYDADGDTHHYLTASIDYPIPVAEFKYLGEQQVDGPQACSTDNYSVVVNPFLEGYL